MFSLYYYWSTFARVVVIFSCSTSCESIIRTRCLNFLGCLSNTMIMFDKYIIQFNKYSFWFSIFNRSRKFNFGNKSIALHKKSPWFINPFLSVVDIHSSTYSHRKRCKPCIHNFEVSLKQFYSIHLFHFNSKGLSYFSWSITKILYFLALNISQLFY